MPEIIHRRTGLSCFYFAMSAVFLVLGLLLLLAGLGRSSDPEPWSEKWIGTVGFIVAGLSWLGGILQMWQLGQSYRNNQVRLTAVHYFLRTPSGSQIEFDIADVREVNWNAGICTVQTPTLQYRFDRRTCPRAAQIAKALAERAHLPLNTEKV